MTSFSCSSMKEEEEEEGKGQKRKRQRWFLRLSFTAGTSPHKLTSSVTMRQHMMVPFSCAVSGCCPRAAAPILLLPHQSNGCTPTFSYIASHPLWGNGAERLTPASLAVTHITLLGFSRGTESVSSSRSGDDWLAGYSGNPQSESYKLLIGTH